MLDDLAGLALLMAVWLTLEKCEAYVQPTQMRVHIRTGASTHLQYCHLDVYQASPFAQQGVLNNHLDSTPIKVLRHV